jgi:hypothetical protein
VHFKILTLELETPVLFVFFRRPDTAIRVFREIRKARPKKLFLAADGPRVNIPGEDQICAKTRLEIESLIDWDCEVTKLYREHNLGCQEAVSLAINWFFSQVEEGIILEDDTLPTQSFFRFASAMLERYRNTSQVMHISGNNFQGGRIRGDGAYYFSRFAHSWGWGTWRRAWDTYDKNMDSLDEEWGSIEQENSELRGWCDFWKSNLLKVRRGEINTWDYQWHYSIRKNRGLCVIPNKNLVKNIGVNRNATHTIIKTYATSRKSGELFRYRAPLSLKLNNNADNFDLMYTVINKWPKIRTFQEMINKIKFEILDRKA